jgi:hypothetical protein
MAARLTTVMSAANVALLSKLVPDLGSWRLPALAVIRGTVIEQEQFVYRDAVLYLAPLSAVTFSELSKSLCRDPSYVEMRTRRLTLTRNQAEADRLMQYCSK